MQIRMLGAALSEANGSLMVTLFEPEEALSGKPSSYSSGSWEEMCLAMQNSYATWWEMEGVLDILDDAHACAARDSEEEIAAIMDTEGFSSEPGSDRTPEELLADMGVNGSGVIWIMQSRTPRT